MKKPVRANTNVWYKVGGTVTILRRVEESKRDEWKVIDEFGMGVWSWFDFRVKEGEIELMRSGR